LIGIEVKEPGGSGSRAANIENTTQKCTVNASSSKHSGERRSMNGSAR
jgi:hypothetical protein